MNIIRSLLALAATSLMATSASAAHQRNVVVNGHKLTPVQLAQLQFFHCAFVPDGSYWLNMQSGAWGYAGNPWRQGWLGDPCRGGNGGGNQRHKSLSERGLLYTPGDLNFR